MTKREPLRGYRRRMKNEEEEEEKSSYETPARGRMKDIEDQKSTGSSRSDRFRRRQDVKEQDDNYELVLKASGIDTVGMDEEEKIELAKILVLSKSEVEQTGDDMCVECPLAGRTSSPGIVLEVAGTSKGTLRRSPTGTRTLRRSPAMPASDNSSDSSVVCLDMLEQKPTKTPDLRQISTQDLKELEEEYDGGTQASPLNASLSQIFSHDEETQPPSQDLFSKAEDSRQGHGSLGSDQGHGSQASSHVHSSQDSSQGQVSQGSVQGQRSVQESSQALKEIPEEIEIADCPTLAEDLVDGDFPVTYHGDEKRTRQVFCESLKDTKSHGSTYIEVKVQSLEDEESPRSFSPVEESRPLHGAGRKRKATHVVDPEPKQGRLEVDTEEPISFSMGTYLLDTDKSHPQVSKPLKRHYRRQRRTLKEKKYFSTSSASVDCNHYTDVIFQLFEAYRMKLRDAQFGRLTRVPWGEPVRVGRHMSRTIDLKKRGRDSCYFERLDPEEDALEEFAARKARELAESPTDTPTMGSKVSVFEDGADKDPDFTPMLDLENDDDDFVSIKKVSRTKKRKSPDSSPEVEELPDVEDWLCSRGGNSGRYRSLGTRGKVRGKAVKRPQLDFVQDKSVENQFDRELAGKRTSLSVKAPSKTYSKRSKAYIRLVRSDSPVFMVGDDEVSSSDGEDESSTKGACPTQSAEKRSVRKTFTFKSSASGKVEVSTEIDVLSGDGDVEEVKGHEWSSHKPKLLSQERSPTFSRSRTGNRPSLAMMQEKSVECSELQSKKDEICCIEEIPSTLPERDEDTSRAGDKTRTGTDSDTEIWDCGRFSSRDNKGRGSQMESKTNTKDDNIDNKKFGTGKKSTAARCLKLASGNKNTQQSKQDLTILDLAKATSILGPSTLETEIGKLDEDNFNIPSSAVFQSRKKRHSSNLFSESDESFNLGVSPVKAFPVIFEGTSSDNSPSSSGHDALTPSPTFGSKSTLLAAEDQQSVKIINPIFPDDNDDDDDVYNATTEEDISTDKETRPISDVQDVPQKHDEHQCSAVVEQDGGQGDGKPAAEVDNINQDKPTDGMACPLCAVTFSMENIEAHASACNGVPPGKASHLYIGRCLCHRLMV
ncbi:uncharacterized protein LOC135475132 [Liolophura sinensis]|uniref:uncharacterized protein LOC135475132 n=1 Tax=Liolophura sinensis TaxID=3198878 RepID=UPI003159776A